MIRVSGSRVTAGLLAIALLLVGCAGTDLTESPGEGTASAVPSTAPYDTPVPTESPGPVATPSIPTPTTTPIAPTPEPTPAVAAVRWPLGLAAMTVTDELRVRSHPSTAEGSVIHQPLLANGTRLRLLEGPVSGSGYWWYRVGELSVSLRGGVSEGWVASADLDGTPWIGPSPEACADFPFAGADITASSFAELASGMLGRWGGCVTTPWVRPYWVDITFRADGTYSATASYSPDGMPAMYYGTDADSPLKRYALNDFQDSLKGIGQIDIYFGPDNTNRGDLRNIALMGDQLEFEFFHRGDYGPLTYRLHRIGVPG